MAACHVMFRVGSSLRLTRREILEFSLATSAIACFPKMTRAEDATEVTPLLEAQLRDDAEQAWKFFELKGKYLRGMLPAIAWYSGNSIKDYPVLAMWDVGSLILACISARSLDLINDAVFEERIDGVATFLKKAVFKWRGKSLPNYQTYISNGRSFEGGFNSTDAGRLLISLKLLDEYTGDGIGKTLVGNWEIGSTIKDGKMHDVKSGGRMIADPAYVYANYASRGYNLWNFEHLSPFDTNPRRDAEAKSKFLDKVAVTGVISTEPHVTEAVELGYSEPAEVLADVLYVAMQKRYMETNLLTCPSEGPIDHEPWFTYQGYEIPRDGSPGRWIVGTTDGEKVWQTEKFAEANRMVATGAAFMWFAVRPDTYSMNLYRHVREKARIGEIGFSPGIYEKSGKPDPIPDINNNALVLEAIAYIINRRRPLIGMRQRPS